MQQPKSIRREWGWWWGGGGVCGDNRRRAGEDSQFPAYHWSTSLWVEPASSTLVEGRRRAALLHSILISKWNRVAKKSASAHHDRRRGFFLSVGELGTAGVNLMSHFKRFCHHFNNTGFLFVHKAIIINRQSNCSNFTCPLGGKTGTPGFF